MGTRLGTALLVGIDEYQHADQVPTLRFASRDAQALADALRDPDLCGFPPERVELLTGIGANRDEIVRRLSRWLPEQASGAELAVLYFAGHGMVHRSGAREEGYLLPFDAEPGDLVARGIAMIDLDRWLGELRTGAIVVILDCCHAGRIIARSASMPQGAVREVDFRPDLLQGIAGKGRYLLASCAEGQQSIESVDLGHGLFTYHLLEGIRGLADRDGNGRVGVTELFEYVAEAVERDARDHFGRIQKPWHHSSGPGGVYLSTPRSSLTTTLTETSHDHRFQPGTLPNSLAELEKILPGADEPRLLEGLRLLEKKADPASVALLFRCLPHVAPAVREAARRAVRAIGWDRTTTAILREAQAGQVERLTGILDGLAVIEANPQVVSLLDRLVVLLKGDLRNRTILLLERKRLGLELDQVAALFAEMHSPYRIERALGQGLTAAAYLARHELTGLQVVVRVLRPELVGQPHLRAAFLDLSSRSMQHVHQNLAMTRDVGAFPDRGIYFAVRDFVDGVTLQKLLESGKRFDPVQILKILQQVLEALTPIHRQRLFHGGIKPSNIFVSADDRVILGDPSMMPRGHALILDRLAYDYRYAPPEWFRSGPGPEPRSDFYALGCVAHELFAGRPPFVSDNHFELAARQAQEPVESLARIAPDLGTRADTYVLRLLQKSPADRFADIEEALAALGILRLSFDRKIPAIAEPLEADECFGPPVDNSSRLAKPAAAPGIPPPAGSGYTPLDSVPLLQSGTLVRHQVNEMSLISMGASLAESRIPQDASDGAGQDSASDRHSLPGDHTMTPEEPASAQQPIVPRRIGKYEILGLIGQGGMGSVYRARQMALNRMVALKTIVGARFTSADALARFRRETEAIAQLQHPNIVQIFDADEKDGMPYYSMELVEGGSLSQRLRTGPLALAEAASMMETLARAIHFAHKQGVIHRDLKPGNILIAADGTPKVSDFGLAKRLEAEVMGATHSGTVVGTPAYMAPEQWRQSRSVGPAADIYSLGLILYQMLAGRLPFQANDLWATFAAHVEQAPPPPSQYRSEIPLELDAICLRCLSKDPKSRYLSADDLADDLHRFLAGQPVEAQRAAPSIEVESAIQPGPDSASSLGLPKARVPRTSVAETAKGKERSIFPQGCALMSTVAALATLALLAWALWHR